MSCSIDKVDEEQDHVNHSYEEKERDFAIRISGVSKKYDIYDNPKDRLKQFIFPRLARIFGKKGKNYCKEFSALKDISFEIKQGQTFGIVGKNGSGKSTLLQIICGTLHPTTGTVEVRGRVAALLELGSGFNPEFTGRENVYFNASILGQSEKETREKFSLIENFADIGDFIDQPVKTYSSGMMVRLAFAVIAHVDADILVIDEALSVGDAFFTQKCMRFLRQFMKSGTVIFVSHDLGAVKNLCDEVVWINQGEFKFQGDAKEACDLYIEELFLNDKGNNKIKRDLNNETINVELIDIDKKKESTQFFMEPDFRKEILQETHIKNNIKVYDFQVTDNDFHTGAGEITLVRLLNEELKHVPYIVGGELVVLEINVAVHTSIISPIIGFYIKDRLGQCLFGDNTWLNYCDKSMLVKAGETLQARFTFRMPMLHVGDYSITASFAEGSQDNFRQHHWIHDALQFQSQTTCVVGGLIGIPMHKITMQKMEKV